MGIAQSAKTPGVWPPDDRLGNHLDSDGLIMTKIEAVFRHWKLDVVKDALLEIGIESMTVTFVRGRGSQRSQMEVFRGREYAVDLPKVKLELVVMDDVVEEIVEAIGIAAHTGEIGDGKIFLSVISDAVRIRNGNHGIAAL